ncbi:glycosyltransferase family 4 protein [Microbulbifer hydrolyticus]|uniref:Glycosyltransferase n=1 Tax=Microbulbifer hydrolyticus TaxID=48074 RepID=A0A6P1TFD0_9GAMM|nr:glycosyltransferase family 4 protein [Microbulbifer hydrolyticus]MBB5212302.1 glycosyltransferase involved in cell wall biosynthesis [Microbulbifer hydrolyticus]QHQ39949.1 glycosyltransferase [Microbulbifer hydrolyticus]
MVSGLKRWLAGLSTRRKPQPPVCSPARFFEADFDAAWYLQAYPDIADAGMDPWLHFTTRGLAEGRLPCGNKAAVLHYRLWSGLEQPVLSELQALSEGRDSRGELVSREERARAARALEWWRDRKGSEGIAQNAQIPGGEPDCDESDCFALSQRELIKSRLFDCNWYLTHNPDVLYGTMDPLQHFRVTGDAEGRDPGPGFSTTGYRYRYPEVQSDESALAHFLREGASKGYSPLDTVAGDLPVHPEAVTIMVCAHQAGSHLYGAERSLLDLLEGFQQVGVNVIVTLPSAENLPYVQAVAARAQTLAILPYFWWKSGLDSCADTVNTFRKLLRESNARALYANTSVLDEPLTAAREEGIPTVVHVRELPQWDDALCQVLHTDSAEWLKRIRASADILVANSATAASAMGRDDVIVLPNVVDPSVLESARAARQSAGGCVNVALISSNLPKKGLADFLLLAEKLSENNANVQCVIFGPNNAHIEALQGEIAAGNIAGNIRLAGYAASPEVALEQSDIVVNLSHFQESFGRTVLEAMAAAKPVVAYDWGALSELVEDGKTGYLVPFGDVDAAVDRVLDLSQSGELRQAMGSAGYRVALQRYGHKALSAQLSLVLQRVESHREKDCKP